jgi:hypothetical protein
VEGPEPGAVGLAWVWGSPCRRRCCRRRCRCRMPPLPCSLFRSSLFPFRPFPFPLPIFKAPDRRWQIAEAMMADRRSHSPIKAGTSRLATSRACHFSDMAELVGGGSFAGGASAAVAGGAFAGGSFAGGGGGGARTGMGAWGGGGVLTCKPPPLLPPAPAPAASPFLLLAAHFALADPSAVKGVRAPRAAPALAAAAAVAAAAAAAACRLFPVPLSALPFSLVRSPLFPLPLFHRCKEPTHLPGWPIDAVGADDASPQVSARSLAPATAAFVSSSPGGGPPQPPVVAACGGAAAAAVSRPSSDPTAAAAGCSCCSCCAGGCVFTLRFRVYRTTIVSPSTSIIVTIEAESDPRRSLSALPFSALPFSRFRSSRFPLPRFPLPLFHRFCCIAQAAVAAAAAAPP